MITAITIAIDDASLCTYAHAANMIQHTLTFYQHLLIITLASGISIWNKTLNLERFTPVIQSLSESLSLAAVNHLVTLPLTTSRNCYFFSF